MVGCYPMNRCTMKSSLAVVVDVVVVVVVVSDWYYD